MAGRPHRPQVRRLAIVADGGPTGVSAIASGSSGTDHAAGAMTCTAVAVGSGASVTATLPCVLVFSGLDPSGGAGLVADAQAIAAQGAHALTVCTALTVQDNEHVYGVQPVDAAMVLRQARALTEKMAIAAVKIGIPGSAANARAIAQVIVDLRRAQPALPVVLDPVLASGHGDMLMDGAGDGAGDGCGDGAAVAALAPLLALATVITPNSVEARALSGAAAGADQAGRDGAIAAQAASLRAQGCRHVLVTGGHDGGDDIINRCYGPHPRSWRWPRLAGSFHGSGCTLAAAIAGQLAIGMPTFAALEQAQHYCFVALRDAYAVAPGQRMPRR